VKIKAVTKTFNVGPLVTFEVFMKWKEEKIKRKAREADKKKK
jgi:hypothetical protein